MPYVLKRYVTYKANQAAPTANLPALFTEKGVLVSHLRFLYTKRHKSQSWIERNVFAVELLLKFINAHINTSTSATEMLRSFVDTLCFGSIDNSNDDQSGLYWQSRRVEDVNVLLGHINFYCDYLDQLHGHELPNLNPLRKATKAEERLRWCAYYKRQSNCFLNHLSNPSKHQFSVVRNIQGPLNHLLSIESVHRFPEEHFERFLKYGFFSKRNGEMDFACLLIVMLMHYGGLRLSECFHIYTSDIAIDTKDGSAIVSVFHPSDGASPEPGFSNRRDYLNSRFRQKPRNEYKRSHKLYSGWKQPLLTNRNLSFDVMLFPNSKATEFTWLLQQYLAVRVDGAHPYLFSNSVGKPESKKNFIQKHKRAVERIGLEVGKHLGTSPHSHRHSYGYRLNQAGFNQLEIQKAMHHKSPFSCLVYLKPEDNEIRDKIRELGL
ncbi:gamma-mobile-trio recombinase GmtY [Shewanella sp. GutDb-MelDb]|uniref:gamma-mobile-trio recombinase GmtY n=1 Tax=Shewanella sp. GutDb-MelDb TaxID=2058316 RepID=UPI000C7DF37B|nr:gamma-mobile-trio recombinase GmtY [Shewanella sp. GutDb-MelDb]PKG56332.1 integrase [Shewanella sp. GutDb-MelDb]